MSELGDAQIEVPKQTVAVDSGGPEGPTPRTIEAALVSLGRRRVNIIWERTQAAIAIIVLIPTIIVASIKTVYDMFQDPERGVAAGPAFIFLVAASNLVVGFYFGRTNHQRVGGVGGGEEGGR